MNGKKGFVIIIGAALILGAATLALAQESSAAADEVEAANLALMDQWVAFVQNRPELVKDAAKYREAHRALYKLSYVYHDVWSDSVGSSSPGNDFEWDKAIMAAFPDLQFTAVNMVASGDEVYVHYAARGTFVDSFVPPSSGMAPLEPAGKAVDESGVYVFRIADSKIVEVWWYVDSPFYWTDKALMLQKGAADAESQEIYNLNNPK